MMEPITHVILRAFLHDIRKFKSNKHTTKPNGIIIDTKSKEVVYKLPLSNDVVSRRIDGYIVNLHLPTSAMQKAKSDEMSIVCYHHEPLNIVITVIDFSSWYSISFARVNGGNYDIKNKKPKKPNGVRHMTIYNGPIK